MRIGVTCSEPAVAALIESRLRTLRTGAGQSGRADVAVDIRGPAGSKAWPARPEGRARPIYDAPSGQIDFFDGPDQVYVHYDRRVRLLCTPARGLIEMSITGSEPGDLVLAAHPLLTIALLETMKRFDRFPLHAGGLSLDGRGILLPGASGAGKSTLTVTLVRAGFGFLSDDTVFLTSSTDGLSVAGFPDEIDVTEHTVAMVPELSGLAGEPLQPGRDKHGFRVEEVFGITPTAASRPSALVFPRLTGGSAPHIEALAPSEALLELTPNVLLTDPAATQAHLDMLAELVRSVPSFWFRPGTDLDAAAACLAETVA